MITLKKVTKSFPGDWQLGPIDLQIQKGDFLALKGKSGSGKSTLLHLASGLIRPDSGEIFFEKEEIHELSEKNLGVFRNRHMGFVFQEYFLLHTFSILENVMIPLLIGGMKKEEAKNKAQASLSDVGLSEKEKSYPAEISGGQRQRAAIARAIVSEPDILFADEPTGNLDDETGKEIITLLTDLNRKKGVGIFLATHDQNLAKRAQKGVVIEEGKIT